MIRKWFKYYLDNNKANQNSLSFTFRQIEESFSKKKFILNYFLRLNISETKIYNFIKKKTLGNVLSVGSGYGELEYHLSKHHKIIATDINQKIINKNYKIKISYLDILNIKSINKRYDSILVPNIEYLLNDRQLLKCLENIKKLSKKETKIFFGFRSCDSFFIKFIDIFLLKVEIILKKIFYFVILKKFKIKKIQHGYRRSKQHLEKILKKKFFIRETKEELYYTEFERSFFLRKFKLSLILGFLKIQPHLYIYSLKIKT